jgi:type I restriction enzyme S subunit
MDTDIVAVTAPRSAALPRSLQGNLRVPSQWHITPLKAFLRVRSERQRPDLPLLSVYRDHGVVPFGSVEGNYNKPSLDLDDYKVVRIGDLVLNKMKTWQGSLAVSGLEGLVSPAYIVCRVGETWHGRFLHYLLRSHPYIAEYAALSYGVRPAQWDMRFEDFRLISALEPPLEQQRAIADFLDRETEKIDALVAKKRRLIELLQEKRTALISHAVTMGLDPNAPMKDSGDKRLGQIPHRWCAERLAMLTDKITNGFVGPTRDILLDEGVPYLQSLHIKSNRIVFGNDYFVAPAWSRKHAKSVLRTGDVLVVQTGDIGQVAVVPPEFEGANCHALIVVSCITSLARGEYLSWVLNSHYGYHALKRIQTGALHPHLNCTFVREIICPLPPLDEQAAIVTWIRQENGKCDRLCATLEQAVARLREYRSALITAAVTGQIDVREYAKVAS